MKNAILFMLVLSASKLSAQSATWDMHLLNMNVCPEWINGNPDYCTFVCAACRVAMNTDPDTLQGDHINWSSDLLMCPAPIGGGLNVVITSGWSQNFDPAQYFSLRTLVHFERNIDTLEVIYGRQGGGCDSAKVSVSINGGTSNVVSMQAVNSYYPAFDTLRITNIGCVPEGTFDVCIGAAGGSTHEFLIKQVRIVASPCLTSYIPEDEMNDFMVMPSDEGIAIKLDEPMSVLVYDQIGRMEYQSGKAYGYVSIPLESGMHIVQVGDRKKKVVVSR